jgi:phosphatidylserine decarboxylase
MAKSLPLPVWDRRAGKPFKEWMRDSTTTYESEPRRSVMQWLESQPLVDWLIALKKNTRRSAKEIDPFVRRHGIDMGEFEPKQYQSFAEFFERRFRPGVRKFPAAAGEMGAFAEARYFGWTRLEADQEFPVKGRALNAVQILGDVERAYPFLGGPVLLCRLAPVDYHHVHYPDDGATVEDAWIGGRLWTVNWRALQNKQDILFSNQRRINVLQTRNFGRLGFVEIGALSVGRIVQTHPTEEDFRRGEEKSVFRYGGSAIAVFGEPQTWRPTEDLLAHTREGIETLVRLGETVAVRATVQ